MKVLKRAWVLTGDGINCEEETAAACRAAGFHTEIFHLSELVERAKNGEGAEMLDSISLLAIPGGFSFGDELGSGRVLALKIRHQLGWDLTAFARAGGIVVGICNGFQTLVSLGVFGTGVALAHNRHGRFVNQWGTLEVEPGSETRSPLLDGIRTLDLPIRHGEGRLLFEGDDHGTLAFTALRYVGENPNGSFESIAGLFDETGRIFGLMPHPEAFVRKSQHPGYYRDRELDPALRSPEAAMSEGAGLQIFRNAFALARITAPEDSRQEKRL
jgi:phosphoribosylformylglycinamidine synthase